MGYDRIFKTPLLVDSNDGWWKFTTAIEIRNQMQEYQKSWKKCLKKDYINQSFVQNSIEKFR